MPSRLQEFLGHLKERHVYLGYIIGGLLIVIDNFGRAQVLRDMWSDAETVATSIHLAWPAHMLTWIGVCFVLLGVASSVWPKSERKWNVLSAESFPQDKAIPDRIFVTLSAVELKKLCMEKTQAEAERAVKPYIGKWIKVQEVVHDIAAPSSYGQLVFFQDELLSYHFDDLW